MIRVARDQYTRPVRIKRFWVWLAAIVLIVLVVSSVKSYIKTEASKMQDAAGKYFKPSMERFQEK